MSVRAKFKVDQIGRLNTQVYDRANDKWGPGEMQNITLSPVYQNGDPESENTKFWDATPSGQIQLNVIHKDAGDYFELGKEYYVDFHKA